MEVKGKIEKVMDVQQVTDTFKKREFVLLVQDGNYPQYIKFETHQDKVSILDQCKVGDEVNVKFNLRGRLYKETAFNTLVAWFIEKAGSEQPIIPQAPSNANVAPPVLESEEKDDLPF